MRDGSIAPLGGGYGGNAVEVDETFIGLKEGFAKTKGGRVRSVHLETITARGN